MTIRLERIERPERFQSTASVGLTRLTLDRADRGNSLSAALVNDLAAALQTCADDGTRVLLIDGAGANFCTGFDLSGLEQESDDSLLARFVRVELLLQQFYRAPYLTIAAAHGKAWGAGADLFAACSQRWVADDASFAFPGAAFGLVLGTSRLAAQVGPARAQAWVATGRRIDADTALAAGLATERFALESLIDAALGFAESTGRVDRVTLAGVRAAAGDRGAGTDAADLARLVESAARPGLVDRIRAYRAASAKPKTPRPA